MENDKVRKILGAPFPSLQSLHALSVSSSSNGAPHGLWCKSRYRTPRSLTLALLGGVRRLGASHLAVSMCSDGPPMFPMFAICDIGGGARAIVALISGGVQRGGFACGGGETGDDSVDGGVSDIDDCTAAAGGDGGSGGSEPDFRCINTGARGNRVGAHDGTRRAASRGTSSRRILTAAAVVVGCTYIAMAAWVTS